MLNELKKYLNRNNPKWLQKCDANLAKGKRHVRFCSEFYKHQFKRNRTFLHEPPWMGRSWQLACMQEVEKLPGTLRVRMDMCQYDMLSHWEGKEGPFGQVLKPTGMLTNSWCLQRELSLRCPRNHPHVHLVGAERRQLRSTPNSCAMPYVEVWRLRRRWFTTLPMGPERVASLSLLCCADTGLTQNDRPNQSEWLKCISNDSHE